MKKNIIQSVVFSVLAGATMLPASAQDSGPLIDKLVEKGILNDQEAEELRADLVKDFNQSSAGKLNISSSVTELKLYGDARYRWQYDDQQNQVVDNKPRPGEDSKNVTQRSRHRFRLRLNADAKLGQDFFAGVSLETANASDSGNQTVDAGYSDSNIYISRVFLGWNIADWGTVVLGKQKNPFYHNELFWDADINPFGLTESIAFHKLFEYEESYQPSSETNGGKAVSSGTTTSTGLNWGNFDLTLIAGQFIYNTDNDESLADSDASTDVYMFEQQLVASYKWENKVSATFAPAFIFYTSGDIGSNASGSNAQPFADATGVSGESRDLLIINAPGEIKFPLGNLNGKFYWDFAYNIDGDNRYTDVYQLGYTVPKTVVTGGVARTIQVDPVSGQAPTIPLRAHETEDDLAWIAGFEIGQGKGKGAWTLFANYRQVGISSIDPNLNDSDFALSRLNIKGWRAGVTYGLTDFISLAATAQIAENLDDEIRGGHATGGANLADRNAVNIYQFDINWKF